MTHRQQGVAAAVVLCLGGTLAPTAGHAAFEYAIGTGINYELATPGKYDFNAASQSAAGLGLINAGDMTTLSGTILHGGGGSPDTRINAYDGDGLNPADSDGDAASSPFGTIIDQAGGLANQPVNSTGSSISLRVTGDDDPNFDGNVHLESGAYDLYVDIFAADSSHITRIHETSTLNILSVDAYQFSDPGTGPAWHSFDAFTVNGNPIDFWVITGLTPGAMLTAEITSSTMSDGGSNTGLDAVGIGQADPDTGEHLAWDERDQSASEPVDLTGLTPSADGRLVLVVSGLDGNNFVGTTNRFDGTQTVSGDYELKLTLDSTPAPVPVPAALPLLASALAGLGVAGWRRRRG